MENKVNSHGLSLKDAATNETETHEENKDFDILIQTQKIGMEAKCISSLFSSMWCLN